MSDVTGSVSLLPVGETTWSSASLNYPLTTGDAVWADADGRAEIHVGSSAVRIAAGTSLAFDAIKDNLIQLRIGQGAVQVRLRALSQDDSYEIDSPAGAILLHAAGDYRIDVTPDGRRTTVTVRQGDADVMVGNDTYPLRQGTSVTLTGNGAPPIANGGAMAPDDWENWADARDRREDAVPATRYVSREMVGYEDLDRYGDWQVDAAYGPVWYPRSVSSDWAPYRTGRWESVQPWGWTWIDEEPWGFAPFHYGRWANQRGRWGWIPGSERARPVYSPAMVAFVSGDGWNASLSLGAGGGVGWVPLGPNEVFVPAYRNSPTYARNINVTNVNVTRIDVTRVDINTAHYANRNIPGAVTAVPRDVFMGSRPVQRAAVPVRPADLARVRVSAAPIAAGVPVAPPPRGSPMDRARPDNAGTIRQPPVALSRSPMTPRRPGAAATPKPISPAGQQDRGRANDNPQPVTPPGQHGRGRPNASQPPVTPPGQQDRGQRYGNQPTVTPPPTAPTIPPKQAQNQGRGRDQRSLPTPIRPVQTPTAPTAPPARGRGQPTQPATQPSPRPPVPATATPTAPPARGRGQPTQPATQPSPRPPVPATATPTAPPARGRGQPTQPAPQRVAPAPAQRPTPPGRAPTTPPQTGRDAKPARTRPDSGHGHGTPALQLFYQE
ncbi:MAG: DUF6600 domain-containing protein [Gemmatimonadales bacterium]